ncbi:hypothetical protein QWZ13_17160 [Reinekea marina]|uniref:hypothetical protein n=1 Tax=Reinekea marina TaxID=1310421 RepID=UPI0025B52A16|nr:hypothetical protein [Reinekea marina]MDN3650637.1 hypothetical protein [Reinekea marina]
MSCKLRVSSRDIGQNSALGTASFELQAASKFKRQKHCVLSESSYSCFACSLQLAACSLQLAACSLQLAACSLQLTAPVPSPDDSKRQVCLELC